MIYKDREVCREIYDVSVTGDHDDIQVMEAFFVDDDSALNDTELDWVQNNCYSELYEIWLNNVIGLAEQRADLIMGR